MGYPDGVDDVSHVTLFPPVSLHSRQAKVCKLMKLN